MGNEHVCDVENLTDNIHIKTEITDSGIPGAGMGRFFKEDCKKGTIVRVQSIDSDLHVFNNLDELKQANLDTVLNFAHTRSSDSDVETSEVFINKQCLYTNHSKDNNIAFKFMENKKITYTTRDVKSGEEMFQNYNDYTPVSWYENYLHTIGKISLRELAQILDNNDSIEVEEKV
jgi:hypothetical protein